MKTAAEHYLAQASLLRLLAVLALVIAPHLLRLPPWVSAFLLVLMLWRAAGALRQWPLPPTWLKVLLAVGAFAGVNATFGQLNGQNPGVALLMAMIGLKLTEMRSRRDVLVVVALCYFVMVTHFLYSQELWTIVYLFGCAVAVTALLIEANHLGGTLAPRVTLRIGGALVLQAVPLMVLLFVLFPRVPGPLWGLPADAGAGRTGLADSMSPGDIARLIESDEVVFRVAFEGPAPPPPAFYWRGPVLAYTDGTRWSAPFRGDEYFSPYRQNPNLGAYQRVSAELVADPVRYSVTLEPHRQNWLLALDVPAYDALPPNTMLTGYYQLVSRELVRDLYRYDTVSYLTYRLQPDLPDDWRRNGTRLPRDRNPRTLALAQGWRDEGLNDRAIVDRALQMFRQQEFFYTLEPGTQTSTHIVDEFLFETRRGFCEHYASSFTTLMRAAGVPARVIAGYQGGEYNELGGYYVIRQYDAHAWSEVWLAGRGWVRVDPTAAVAPQRVQRGVSAALADAELPDFLRRQGSDLLLLKLRVEVAWDMVNVMWDRWVLAYSPQLQQDFLARFGLDDWSKMVIALVIGLTGAMSLIGMFVLWRTRPARHADKALALWRAATRRLARAGLPQGHAEGPADYAQRIAQARPELAPAMQRVAQSYVAARYLASADAEAELKLAVRALEVPRR